MSTAPLSKRPSYEVVIVGGGTAGLTTAARLRRAGVTDVAVVDPAETHYYQPLWTLVGAGQVASAKTGRPQKAVIPRGVTWRQEAVDGFDPESSTVTTTSGTRISYRQLVVAPGLALRYEKTPGLLDALDNGPVSSNYRFDLAPRTWELIKNLRSGTAVFSQPSGPIKCAGAPQKIAYLAADHWRREGVLDRIRVVLVLPDPVMFKVPVWAAELERIAARYGIEVRLSSEVVMVESERRELTIADNAAGEKDVLHFDFLHATPPQAAPDFVADSQLADPTNPLGYIDVDHHTMAHKRYPNIWALGDVANLPTSKTGAAIRKQAPVVVANVLAARSGTSPTAAYDGYTSCPLVTAKRKMLLAEFDYDLNPTPSVPLVDTTKEHTSMWALKRWGLPALYWHGMLKGRA